MLDETTPPPAGAQYRGSFQELADARRVLKIVNRIRHAQVLPAEDRIELERIRSLAIRSIEAATSELIETLDALDDPDAEPDADELGGDGAEDEEGAERCASIEGGPGCPISDAGGCEHDRREPDDGV